MRLKSFCICFKEHRMKIGVSAHFQFSLFSSGHGGTSLAIAETLRSIGYDVFLVNTNDTVEWWDDCKAIHSIWKDKILHLESILQSSEPFEKFDLFLEIGKTAVSSTLERNKLAHHCIYVSRKSAILKDIEASLYPFDNLVRSFDGLREVWLLDLTNTQDDKDYLEHLTKCPTRFVPFVWTPSLVEAHRAEMQAPEWLQVFQFTNGKEKPWKVHICETNNSSQSSCTIPLLALRELKRTTAFPIKQYVLHNADHVRKSEFFRKNVEDHSAIADLSGEYVGRQRIIDFVFDSRSCLFSHGRFHQIRPMYLDAVWTGIPMVHNSLWISKELPGTGYDKTYYPDNEITSATKAFCELNSLLEKQEALFSLDGRNLARKLLLEKITPFCPLTQSGWKSAIESLQTVSASTPTLTPVPAPPPPQVSQTTPATTKSLKTLKILFTDMWDDFNAEYNMFVLLTNEAGRHLNPPVKVLGCSESQLQNDETPDLVVFGPFGDSWRKYPDTIPKVHYTGENSQIIKAPGIVLNIGFQHSDFVDQEYLRIPLWMLEIDWFGADKEKIVNPKPLSIDRCCSIFVDDLALKKKFCAFVVTNPCNPVRNQSFHSLSQYKQVDSAGRLFNNIGDAIFAGRGGGGGELKKFEFLKDYKFCLAYENSSSQGYTTEKYLHAKAAGCIPIYWGDPKFERDFDINGCIDARRFTTPEELIEAVRAVDTNPAEWLKKFSIPALDPTRRDLVRRTLSECARRFLKHMLKSEAGLEAIPRFLGATTDAEAKKLAELRDELPKHSSEPLVVSPPLAPVSSEIPILLKPKQKSALDKLVITTGATRRFLPSLYHWLIAFHSQKNFVKDLRVFVWLGEDVPTEQVEAFQKEYPWMHFEKLPTTLSVPEFPDLWEPQHFAWKLWILQYINRLEELKDFTALYLDTGAFMCKWPSDWLHIATEEEVCLLDDSRQTNGQWCHKEFCDTLQVTESEKAQHQIWAGALAFRAGSAKATKLFDDAWALGKRRALIVGPKWAGVGPDKKPFGHRHDQSILSLLSGRMNLARYPLDNVYCDYSLRMTFLKKLAFYVHRTSFSVHKPFAPGIDDCYVINLDRRKDRMEKLYKNHPEFDNRILRLSAYEGKNLQLTPAIARVFRNHDFKWKKPVMGCALSHLSLWWQLAHENQEIESYLILEDDVKFQPGWEQRWCEASAHLPEGWDVIYLGGILPPNRAGFDKLHERVNQYFSRVAPNSFYGQNPPNRYFHFCNYSYILSKQGAQKILELIKAHDGIWTSGDHCVCNQVNVLNHYFIDPLVAGCYQDDDPKYQTAHFNDFARKDEFDSDLWNNNEHFHEDDANALSQMNIPLDIVAALRDGRQTIEDSTMSTNVVQTMGTESPQSAKENLTKEIQSAPTPSPTPTPSPAPDSPNEKPKESCWQDFLRFVENKNLVGARNCVFTVLSQWEDSWWVSPTYTQFFPAIQECLQIKQLSGLPPRELIEDVYKQWRFNLESKGVILNFKDFVIVLMTSLESFLRTIPLSKQTTILQKRRIVALDEIQLKADQIYEKLWLQELLGPDEPLFIQNVNLESPIPNDCPIVIFMRPWVEKITVLLEHWRQHGAKFYLLHLSDEYASDTIDVYKWPECLGVVRIYNREDCKEYGEKVVTVPLGYHWSVVGGVEDAYEKTPRLPFREYAWSFLGTNWHGRKEAMNNLTLIQPHRVEWYDQWNDPKMVGQREYQSILLNSVFVPCPGGNNAETFRFYEALENGCIPLYVRCENDSLLVDEYKKYLPIADLPNWDYAAAFMYQLAQKQESLESYRYTLLKGWGKWKTDLKTRVRTLFQI